MRMFSCARRVGLARLAGVVGLACGVLGFIAVPGARALAPPNLFWTNFGSETIGEASLDGTNINQSFAMGGASGAGVAVDGQHVYWAQNTAGEIVRANLDGTDVEPNFISGLADPIGVAVDSTHVYWANNVANSIGEANLDGTGVNNAFITGATEPAGVAVDGRHIYWTNAGSGTIGEANLDGTDVNQSLVTGANFPIGIALDGQHIYWTNIGDNTIGEANLDGTDVNESFIATGDSNLFMLATDGQRLYWPNFAPSPNGTLGEANVDGTNVNPAFITGASSPAGVAVSVPVAQVSPASPPSFAATPQGTLSHPVTLTLSNTGQRSLTVSGLSFSGADPGDYIVTSNSCLGSVAPGESCEITVGFAPQGQGQRTATLQIASNDYANSPLQIPFSGAASATPAGATGVVGQPGPQGPPGSTGARGATGPRGSTGSRGLQGRSGKIELITCRPVIKKINGRRHKVQRCTGRLMSGTVRFTTSSNRVSIERGRVTYATGVSVPLSSGRTQLMLVRARLMRAGAYTLVARGHHGRKLNTRRTRITITT